MREETCGLGLGTVPRHSVSAQCNSSQSIILGQLSHEIDAVSVRQPEIADDKIKRMGTSQQDRILHRGGSKDVMAMRPKQTRKNIQRCLVILDDEKSKRIGSGFWLSS